MHVWLFARQSLLKFEASFSVDHSDVELFFSDGLFLDIWCKDDF